MALRRFLLLSGPDDGQELGNTIALAGSEDQAGAKRVILGRIQFDSPEQKVRFREAAEWEAQRLVQEHWQEVARVAEALVERSGRDEVLTQDEVEAIRRGPVGGSEVSSAG